MATWIVLLRGINVGGHSSLSMQALRDCLTSIGCKRVQTYIQSGNAVVDHPARSAAALARRIEQALNDVHQIRPETVVCTTSALREVISHNPYPQAAQEPRSVHAFFLGGRPDRERTDKLAALAAPGEQYTVTTQCLYLYAPDGIARSRLARGVERTLGVRATARNWRTVEQLMKLAEGAK